jgi:hypothetical protein
MKSREIKLKIYTTIKPTVLYGCKTCAMKTQIKPPLKTWEQKTLREIYSQIKIQMAGETELTTNYS